MLGLTPAEAGTTASPHPPDAASVTERCNDRYTDVVAAGAELERHRLLLWDSNPGPCLRLEPGEAIHVADTEPWQRLLGPTRPRSAPRHRSVPTPPQ